MEAFAVAYAAATLAAFVSVLVYRELRGVWKELSLVDVGVYAGLTVAAVAVSLSYCRRQNRLSVALRYSASM